jgi:hypothetical protein
MGTAMAVAPKRVVVQTSPGGSAVCLISVAPPRNPAMSDTTEIVACDIHGTGHACFVCKHLTAETDMADPDWFALN